MEFHWIPWCSSIPQCSRPPHPFPIGKGRGVDGTGGFPDGSYPHYYLSVPAAPSPRAGGMGGGVPRRFPTVHTCTVGMHRNSLEFQWIPMHSTGTENVLEFQWIPLHCTGPENAMEFQ